MVSIDLGAALPGSRKRPDTCICQTHQSGGSAPGVHRPDHVPSALHKSRNPGIVAVRFIRSAAMMGGIKTVPFLDPGGANDPVRITLPAVPFSRCHRPAQEPARPQNAAGRSPSSERGEFP